MTDPDPTTGQGADPPRRRRITSRLFPARSKGDGTRSNEGRYSAVVALVGAGILVVLVLGVLVVLLAFLNKSDQEDAPKNGPEAALSLVFVATVVVLILVVCTLSIVFKRLDIYDANEAMGLPRGSVRAVIALLLIMLFFISAVFLFNSTKNGGADDASRTLVGISEDQFNAIDIDDVQSSVQREVDGETVYDVTRTANTTTSNDIAKQLVTTVATLVTAVAAFYFGANSVTTALKEARHHAPGGGAGRGGDPQPGPPDPAPAKAEEAQRRSERPPRPSG